MPEQRKQLMVLLDDSSREAFEKLKERHVNVSSMMRAYLEQKAKEMIEADKKKK